MKKSLKKISAVIFIMVFVIDAAVNTKTQNVAAETVLVSPEISIEGYQMKTNVSSGEGITFRTVCRAPNIGSVITIDGKNYTVVNLGTIYTKDPNTNGKAENNVLSKSYTELDPNPYPESAVKEGYRYKYVGQTSHNDQIVTFGYIASDKGILNTLNGYTSYVRTLTNMDRYVQNSLHIRPFVEAVDEEQNEVLIYGQYASSVSVAEIAYTVYINSMAPDLQGHEYLFDEILHNLSTANPFYLETPEQYWSGVVAFGK